MAQLEFVEMKLKSNDKPVAKKIVANSAWGSATVLCQVFRDNGSISEALGR